MGDNNNTGTAPMRSRYLLLTLPILLMGCLDDDNDRRGYRGHSDGYRSGPVYSDRDRDYDRERHRDRGSRSGSDYSDRDRNRRPSASELQRACQQGNRDACVSLNREIERQGGGQYKGQPPWENRGDGSLR